jgi:hypothetical protein
MADVPLVNGGAVVEAIACDELILVINHAVFATSIVEAVILWPVVREQLQIDACARRFARDGRCARR